MKKTSILTNLLFLSSLCLLSAQSDLNLSLVASQPTLLEGETATFTFILENTSATDISDVTVAFTELDDAELVEGSTTATNGTYTDSWDIPTLAAGASDKLQLELSSTGYTFFIVEVISDINSSGELLARRCSGFRSGTGDYTEFYEGCSKSADEVIYPTERFDVNFVAVDCFPTQPTACGAKYNVTVANTADVASASLNLFLRAFLPDGAPFYAQSGPTLTLPSIPANNTIVFTADFGDCVEPSEFATLEGLDIGLTQSDVVSLFAVGRTPFSLSEIEDSRAIEYCAYNNQTDIEILVESSGIIGADNTASFKVMVTNLGNETAEFVQITYGVNQYAGDVRSPIITYSGQSDFSGSSFSEERTIIFDRAAYWNLVDLSSGDTAIMTATVFVSEDFFDIDDFTTDIFLSENSFVEDPNPTNNQKSIFFERRDAIDLALKMETSTFPFTQFEPNTVILALTNNGNIAANNIEVALDLSDKTQAVLVGEFDPIASVGMFRPVSNLWQIEELMPGMTATLEVQYFPLVENYIAYAQVTAADQEDLDSTPGNGSCCTVNEDDEAIISAADDFGLIENRRQPTWATQLSIYPNPTTDMLQFNGQMAENTIYFIIDLLGKTVEKGRLQDNQVEVSHLTNGAYFLVTEIGVWRFVKQ
ncbi:MAG: T9SS type A sorting domain-containing protein [Bacteroidota bacterium]